MDSDAFRFGQFVAQTSLLLPALVLLVWGFQQRKVYEKRQEGRVKLRIAASLLAAFGLTVAVSMVVGPKAADDADTTEVASSEADNVLDGANRYLRGIDQVRATGSVEKERFDITFVDDDDAVGTLMSGDVKLTMRIADAPIVPPAPAWPAAAVTTQASAAAVERTSRMGRAAGRSATSNAIPGTDSGYRSRASSGLHRQGRDGAIDVRNPGVRGEPRTYVPWVTWQQPHTTPRPSSPSTSSGVHTTITPSRS